ncbi:MAG: PfkB family carbohydrate kinase, partial [Actinomycetota bacterium]|nr:PfkB family carbohydrate kinase [Actinomycetota bacterium]
QGPKEVVLKRGERGSLVLLEGEVLEQPAFPAVEVDPIGAGDASDAGYLAGHQWGLAPEERLRTANAMGALSVATLGDYEGLPGKDELRDFIEGRRALGR